VLSFFFLCGQIIPLILLFSCCGNLGIVHLQFCGWMDGWSSSSDSCGFSCGIFCDVLLVGGWFCGWIDPFPQFLWFSCGNFCHVLNLVCCRWIHGSLHFLWSSLGNFCDVCFSFVDDGIPLILVWVCFMAMQIEQPFPKLL